MAIGMSLNEFIEGFSTDKGELKIKHFSSDNTNFSFSFYFKYSF